jgi:hypothetical protein
MERSDMTQPATGNTQTDPKLPSMPEFPEYFYILLLWAVIAFVPSSTESLSVFVAVGVITLLFAIKFALTYVKRRFDRIEYMLRHPEGN